MVSKYEMLALIEDNFVKTTNVSNPSFKIILFVFACLYFHYTYLDTHIHKIHHLRASEIFIAVGRSKHIHKFALNRYSWTITMYTPYFKGLPLYFILISEMESLKANLNSRKEILFRKRELNLMREMLVGIYTNLDVFLTK